jgi:DNA-binding transcriptional LysR family regulator
MELHEIRYFVALAKALNFTKAAEACHVSQPALTRAIQKLEEELGGLLFSRERGNTHLTELGRMVEPHLEEVVARTIAAKETAARFLRLDSAQLRIGVISTIGPVRFAHFLNRFRSLSPGVELTLIEGTPGQLIDQLSKGEIDLALMARPGGFDAPLQSQSLYRERFVIACSAGHAFAARNVVHLADLHGQTYLQRLTCEFRDHLRELCDAHGVDIVRSYRSEREDWVLTMVAAGMGVCFLPEFSNTVPGVISRPVIDPVIEREVSLVTVAGRRWSSPVAAFVKAIRRYRWPGMDAEPTAAMAAA